MIQRLVVPTEGKPLSIATPGQRNPFVLGTLPMAIAAAGEPVQHIDEAPSYRDRPAIVILGHGEPGVLKGSGKAWDGPALVKELTTEGRAISAGTDLQLWSCHAAARPKSDPSLVESVRDGLQAKGVGDVTVSGVVGTSWTNTATGKRLSGPEADAEADRTLGLLQYHYLIETGLVPSYSERKFPISPDGHERFLKYGRTPPPETVEDAFANLSRAKPALAKLPASEHEAVVLKAINELDRLMSADRDVMALMKEGTFDTGALKALRTKV
jgi:hypothetical protein